MTLLLLEGLSGKFFPSVALDCLRPSNFCLHHQSLNAASTVSPSITQSRSPDRLRCLTGPSVALMLTGGAIRRCCCPPGVNSATRDASRCPSLPLPVRWSRPSLPSTGGTARRYCCPEVWPVAVCITRPVSVHGSLLPVLVSGGVAPGPRRADCRVSTTKVYLISGTRFQPQIP